MERFVFVAAITIAIIFGVGAMFGGTNFNFGRHFNFEVDGDVGAAPIVELSPGRMEQQAFQGDSLRFKSVAATVVIVPEDRTDYLIDIDNSRGRTPMPTVSSDEGRITIDGQLRGRIEDCEGGGASLNGYENVAAADLPVITIHTPRTLNIDRGGAGSLQIGASQAVTLDFSGCSAVTIGDVAEELNLDVNGSGQIQAARANHLVIDAGGSGDVTVGDVAAGASLDRSGSGSVTIAAVTGEFTLDGSGSGRTTVSGGAISTANVDLSGSGGVDLAAPVQNLTVSLSGSSSVNVTAPVGNLDAEVSGSGSVRAPSVTGTLRREVSGSGDVRVGQ